MTRHLLAGLALCLGAVATRAEPVAMDDEALSQVDGGDGISVAVHLQLDTTLAARFTVDGVPTYLMLHGLGGTLDLFTLTLDVRQRPDGADFIDIGLPSFLGASGFGFKALTVQTDPTLPPMPAASYGALSLDGTATVTGHIYLWGR